MNANTKTGFSRVLTVTFFVILFMIVVLFTNKSYAAQYAYTTDYLNLRTGIGTSSDIIYTIDSGDKVNILDGPVSGWYKVNHKGTEGYVSGDYLRFPDISDYVTDPAFELSISVFPDSYKNDLRVLHTQFPNWVFKADITDLNANSAVDAEFGTGSRRPNLIHVSRANSNKSKIDGDCNYFTGEYKTHDDGGYVSASKTIISYYLNPANFLDPIQIFQFISSKYDSDIHKSEDLQKMLNGTFMEGNIPGENVTYNSVIMQAASASNVSPFTLASMIIQEQGADGKGGCIYNTNGYYNFFNINAVRSGETSAVTNGLEYARKQDWNTRSKSIIGGAKIYGAEYVNNNQNTLYTKKFNVNNGLSNVGQHQYETNVEGAYREAAHMERAYRSIASSASLVFHIPVYSGEFSHTHSATYIGRVESNCVKNGHIGFYQCSCGRIFSDAACSNELSPSELPLKATGKHSYGKWTVTKQPTTSSTGIKQRKCSVCGHTESQTVPKVIGNTSERIFGYDRFETSLKNADYYKQQMGISKFDNVIIANGHNFPDALSASYLAKVKNAPIILIDEKDTFELREYIYSNVKVGANIYLVGGYNVIPSTFETQMKNSGYNMKRFNGSDRYETNLMILKECGVRNQDIMVCSGTGYADTISASAVGKPIMIVGNCLSIKQAQFLRSSNPSKVYVIGGNVAVKYTVDGEIDRNTNCNISRIAGSSRYETSTEIAKVFFGYDIDTVAFTYAMNFPDGLSAGPVAMNMGCPIILTDNNCYEPAKTYLKNCNIKRTITLGGPGLISDWTVNYLVGK